MRIMNVHRERIADAREVVCITATIASSSGRTFTLWLELPVEHEEMLGDGNDGWLVLLSIMGAMHREDVFIEGPVDPVLLDGVRSLLVIWRYWYPSIYVPQIDVTHVELRPALKTGLVGSFFSAGIDSLFTSIRHSNPIDVSRNATCISDVLIKFLHLKRLATLPPDAEEIVQLERYAARQGKRFIPIGTNLINFSPLMYDRWARLTHAAAMVAVGHLLNDGLGRLLIASSHTYAEIFPWGSHPLTDPLVSSSRLSVVHDGAAYGRFAKTALVVRDAAALPIISVCDHTYYTDAGARNCSHCQKCLRTMTALDLLGLRDNIATSFNWSTYTPDAFGRLFIRNPAQKSFATEMHKEALKRGRMDIAKAIERGEARSRRYRWLETLMYRLRDMDLVMAHKPTLMRLRDLLFRSLALRKSV